MTTSLSDGDTMTNKPSIESLREIVYGMKEPSTTAEIEALDAALSELESLRAENERLTAWAQGIESTMHGLRAENARLVAERDGLKEKLAAEMYPMAVNPLAVKYAELFTAERARADALAARVEMMKQVSDEMLYQFSEPTFPGTECRQSGHVRLSTITAWRAFLNSTPTADLSAHDAKVREPLELEIHKLQTFMVNIGEALGVTGHWNPEIVMEALPAHDARVKEEAAEKCASAYWASVAPKGVGAMHPSLEFWRMALGLPERTGDEIDASILEARRLFSGGAMAITDERRRQIEQEGWTPEHDDEHDHGELAAAASQYAWVGAFNFDGDLGSPHLQTPPENWPWSRQYWKPTTRRRNLVKAGALIAAEIDRLDRRAAILGTDPSAPDTKEMK